MTLAPGTKLGSYEIIGVIGAGGMGEVYRARDTNLDRDVAIKVLPEHMARDPETLRRFKREAKAVATLSHPNILAIHEFGEHQGIAYTVTELLVGRTLREMLQSGPIALKQAVSLALQMVHGLAAAHEKGVVHRDLKPENLFITREDRLKILDFGLAKVDVPAGAATDSGESMTFSRFTAPGTVLGTVGYMSPEQARGLETDHRTDIFSFGVILYEMLGGERAFKGDYAMEITSSILKDDPPELPRHVPVPLKQIVTRCLAKDRPGRFQSVRDIAFAVETASNIQEGSSATTTQTESEETPSIAVIPFNDMSPQKDQDYFCEGMAEEIINALSRVEGLRVASRTSAFQFNEKSQDIRRMGEALNVKAILEGGVRTAGSRIRVTTQLVNVEDGYHIWSERYDGELEDVFAIQDEIAANIVAALELKLVGPRSADQPKRHSDNLEAYQLFLKGRHNWHRRHKDSLIKAAGFFEQATEVDPNYALAYAGLADTYGSLAFYGYPPLEGSQQAITAAERALALDGNLAEASAARGLIRFHYHRDWVGAEKDYKRALELDPAYVLAYCWYSFLLSNTGRLEEGIDMAKQAQDLDPLSPYVNTVYGSAYLWAGLTEKALPEFTKALDMDDNFALTLYFLGGAHSRARRHEEAIRSLEKAATLTGRASFSLGWLGWIFASAGREDEARSLLSELHERAQKEYVAPSFLAWIYGGLRHKEKALEQIEKSYETGDPLLSWLVLPPYDQLRLEARFKDIRRQLNLGAWMQANPSSPGAL